MLKLQTKFKPNKLLLSKFPTILMWFIVYQSSNLFSVEKNKMILKNLLHILILEKLQLWFDASNELNFFLRKIVILKTLERHKEIIDELNELNPSNPIRNTIKHWLNYFGVITNWNWSNTARESGIWFSDATSQWELQWKPTTPILKLDSNLYLNHF